MKEARTDFELLADFAEGDAEGAFAELVHRYIDLVHSVAARQLGGDSHLARDATQAVFCELARSARKLRGHRTLSGWLYTTTRYVASRMGRSEARRAAREQVFAMKTTDEAATEAGWKEVESLLDDAMQDLSSQEREAVLLRYFRNESFGAIGEVFGASENAARMRVERALEKLRLALKRRGVTCPSAVLSALIAANAISTAPAGLAAAISVPAIASAATATFPHALKLIEIMATTKMKAAAAVLALAGTTTGWIMAQRNAGQLEAQVTELRQQAAEMPGNARAAGDAAGDADDARFRAERNELMRLRGEVTELRRQLRAQPAMTPPAAGKAEPLIAMTAEEQAKDELKMRGIARLNVARGWGMAFYKFAQANEGRMPADFETAKRNYPEVSEELLKIMGAEEVGGASGDGFEITFQGKIEEIENPAEAIIMREKEPFHYKEDGSAARTYLFADGHSEIHTARDADFTAWEEKRQPRLKEAQAGQE
jgi:RNA polymerase sigma factor (sigma-70 family)